MANEARVSWSLSIRKQSSSIITLNESKSGSFQATVTGTKGPTPGAIAVTSTGVDIDLSELTTPGLCILKNMDATNYIQLGRWNGVHFYPVMRLLPGEEYVIRLDPDVGDEYTGAGTGTGSEASTLRAKSPGGNTVLQVLAYEN